MRRTAPLRALLAALALVLALGVSPAAAYERSFPETGQTVRDAFLDFFDANGGVDVFGYPRTGEFVFNGHYVQYFQRARFEYWPENPPGQQVQLGLLAVELGRSRPPSPQSADPNRRWFRETQHSVGGGFLDFWTARGGAAVFGYPITDEMDENGRAVQYFQRARFEWHGENPPAYRVQLGLLGDESLALGKVPVPSEAAPKQAVTGPPPIDPSAAGPGKLLVSTGIGGDFYLMDPNGANAVKLGRGVDPAISRDGNKITFALWDSPNPGIYVMDADVGSKPTLVYQGTNTRGPVLSPDNSQIAFYESYKCVRIVRRQNIEDDCYRVKVVPTAGGQDWLIPGQSAYATTPTWSWDGTQILFKDEKALYVASRTQDAQQLSQFEPRYYLPAWSPLGGRVLVQFDANRDHYEVGVVPDDGSVGLQLLTQSPPFTNPPQTSLSPAWSPDGSRIAFASDRDGALRIWTMAADGTAAVKVSDIPLGSQNVLERFVSWGGGPLVTPAPAASAPPPVPAGPTGLRPQVGG
jgi:hypothetical protein